MGVSPTGSSWSRSPVPARPAGSSLWLLGVIWAVWPEPGSAVPISSMAKGHGGSEHVVDTLPNKRLNAGKAPVEVVAGSSPAGPILIHYLIVIYTIILNTTYMFILTIYSCKESHN
jgi:hypothetical protein